MQVLERALEKAEAEELERDQNRTLTTQPRAIRFVHGGTLRSELGTQPSLRASVGTNTDNQEDGENTVTITARPKRCEIHLDYARINQMQLEGHLATASVFDMTRLFLAYLCRNRDCHYRGQTYVSVKVKLRALGFPDETNNIKKVYLAYCCSQGITEEEVENDLLTLGNYIRGRNLEQAQITERHRREEAERIYQGRPSSCDPECTIL